MDLALVPLPSPTSKCCTHCGKTKHLTQFYPSNRGPKPAKCSGCVDNLRALRKEVSRDQEVLSLIQKLY